MSGQGFFRAIRPTLLALVAVCALFISTASAAASSGKDDAAALYQQAEVYLRNNFKGKALEFLLAVVERFPQSPQAPTALDQIGQIYLSNNAFEQASHYYQLLVSQYPENPLAREAHLQMGICQQKLGRHDLAVQALGYYLSIQDVKQPDLANRLIADSYLILQRYSDALLALAIAAKRAEHDQQVELLKQAREIIDEHLSNKELLTLLPRMTEGPITDFVRFHVAEDLAQQNRPVESRRLLRDMDFTKRQYKFYDKAEKLLESLDTPGKPQSVIATQPGARNPDVPLSAVPSTARYSIGLLLPLSGSKSAFGREVLQGVMQGVNLFGVSNGAPYRVQVRDTQGDPAVTVQMFQQLAADPQILAVVGPLLSHEAEAAAPEAERLALPLITLTTSNEVLTKGRWIFRNFLTAEAQVQFLVRYASQQQGAFRFAVLYPDNKQGQMYRDLFSKYLDASHQRLVATVGYPPDETDFKRPIKQLNSAGGFDALFIPDSDRRVALLAPQLVYYGIKEVMLLGINSWNNDQLARDAGAYMPKSIFVDGFFTRSSNPLVEPFVSRFSDTFHHAPSFLAAVGFDTARMLSHILSRTTVTNREAVRRELLNLDNFPGVTGELTIGEDRDTHRGLYLLRVGDTQIQELF